MKSWTFIRFLIVGITSALILGFLTLISFREFTENSSNEFRKSVALLLARSIENDPSGSDLERQEHLHPESRLFRNKIWLTDIDGHVLLSNSKESLPVSWGSLPKPEKDHEIALGYRFLGLTPAFTIVRLSGPGPAYLILSSAREDQIRKSNFLKILFVGLALAFSALTSMLMTFYYLRRKSKAAREVLLRLERGDLKARFQIRHFDEIGSLMLDFNRMASEIERLVGRLEETEQARKTMFQELSHDLRTPLTSLRASMDTLASHWEEMPSEHRKEVIAVSQAEVSYFTELLESLLFIAQMDEPRYKKNAAKIRVYEILQAEVRIRQTQELSAAKNLKWDLITSNKDLSLPGDAHLMRRLVKNLIENAGRFAHSSVKVRMYEKEQHLIIEIEDDGDGMTPEDIDNYGKSRTRRLLDMKDLSHVSLGLGSVIVKKILDLHQGNITVQSSRAGSLHSASGTLIAVSLPMH